MAEKVTFSLVLHPEVARSLLGAAANVRGSTTTKSPTTHAPAEAVVSTFGHWLPRPTAANPCAADVHSCGGNLPVPLPDASSSLLRMNRLSPSTSAMHSKAKAQRR